MASIIKQKAVAAKRKLALGMGKRIPVVGQRALRNPIFVIGCGRSGTTLIANFLGTHKAIAHWSEANELWDPERYPWFLTKPDCPPIWFAPHTYTRMWWNSRTEEWENWIKGCFGTWQLLSNGEFFLNKSPMNTFRIPHLLELFPDARFIHVVRDGRAVVNSYAKKQYKHIMENEPEEFERRGYFRDYSGLQERLAQYWVENIREVETQKSELGLVAGSDIVEIRYEDFCLDPQGKLNELAMFIGIDPDGFDLSNYETQDRNFKWKRELDGQTQQHLGLIMSEELQRKEYAS